MSDNASTIQLEFAYTLYCESCRDPYLTDGTDSPPQLRQCRRRAGHKDGPHASGHGSGYVEWTE